MRNRLFFRRRSAEGRIFHLHLVEASTWDSRKEHIVCLTDGTSTEEEAPQREDERTSRRLLTSNTSSGTTPLQTQSRSHYGVGEFRTVQVDPGHTRINWTYSFKLNDDEFPGELGAAGRCLSRVRFLNAAYA